jgi:transcriptional regulator with XRE-family HTH domain
MPVSEFATLLSRHMRRIRASAGGVASEIGMSREAVNNWRNGDSLPSRKHRDKVLACATYLRLSESETNDLLAAVGFEAEFPVESPEPADTLSPAIKQVFDQLQQLRPYPILMLLTQAHLGQPPEREAMLAEAQQRYGSDGILHVQPPFSLNTDAAGYFSAIALQCGFEGIASDHAFEAALARRLQRGSTLFCLVSRFEQGDPAQREVLAGILRSLSEMHSGRLHLLICGGTALADLKYQGGDLSLLNIATTALWPELGVQDMERMARRRTITGAEATRALHLCGGHPLLADAALSLLAENAARSDDDLVETLAAYAPLWQGFLPLLAEPTARAAIAQHLQRSQLAPARPYLLDPLLRALFWANLIVARSQHDGAWLQWRCEAIRRAGALIIGQLERPA